MSDWAKGFMTAMVLDFMLSVGMHNSKLEGMVKNTMITQTQAIDINKDGKTDLGILGKYYMQTGDGKFLPAQEYFKMYGEGK